MKRSLMVGLSVLVLLLGFLLGCAPKPAAPTGKLTILSVAGSQLGGGAYRAATAWSTVINKYNAGVLRLDMQVTSGSEENMKLVNEHKSDIAPAGLDRSRQAIIGEGKYKTPYTGMVGLMNSHAMFLQVFVLDKSPIKSIEDLNRLPNLRVVTGAPAGSSRENVPKAMKAIGIDLSRHQILNMIDTDIIDALKTGTIDITLNTNNAAPMPAFSELALRTPLRMIHFTEAQVAAMVKAIPGTSRGVIKANTYKGQSKEYVTVASWSIYIVRNDLPEDIVYRIVKTADEHNAEHVKANPQAWTATAKGTAEIMAGVIPLHPGTERYLKEKRLLK